LTTVTKWLTSNSINGGVVTGEYKGETDPVHNCEDCEEEKHDANRRATIVVSF